MKVDYKRVLNVLFLSLTGVIFSCNSNSNSQADYGLYYFPDKNIYYDSLQTKFYYSLNGARSWDSTVYTAPTFGNALGRKILIEKVNGNVWKDNVNHRKQYNGVLLNIINDYTILLTRVDSIDRNKPVVPIKKKHINTKKEEEPKKGFKKFLEKIFGKKE